MPLLDTVTKIVRLATAIVWLGVGVVTFWGTWVTFREVGPLLETFAASVRAVPSGGSLGLLPGVALPGTLDRGALFSPAGQQ